MNYFRWRCVRLHLDAEKAMLLKAAGITHAGWNRPKQPRSLC